MSGVTFSGSPPKRWEKACVQSSSLFHTLEWQSLLNTSFGCRTLYAWDEDSESGGAIAIFRAGPFRVGYLGFPVGGILGNQLRDLSKLLAWRNYPEFPLPTCIRIASSGFSKPIDLPFEYRVNPETAIVDLQNWNLEKISKNLRRDVNKAKRSNLSIVKPSDAGDANTLYRIYRATVQSQGGALRYNGPYFHELAELATRQSKIQVWLAKHKNDIAGFIVLGLHGGTAYYLHGGTDTRHRLRSPADLLLSEAIQWARDEGCECFNLMSSPNDQPSLVKFKEKWGGETRQHKTYTLPVGSSYRVFKVAEYIYRWLR